MATFTTELTDLQLEVVEWMNQRTRRFGDPVPETLEYLSKYLTDVLVDWDERKVRFETEEGVIAAKTGDVTKLTSIADRLADRVPKTIERIR